MAQAAERNVARKERLRAIDGNTGQIARTNRTGAAHPDVGWQPRKQLGPSRVVVPWLESASRDVTSRGDLGAFLDKVEAALHERENECRRITWPESHSRVHSKIMTVLRPARGAS